MQNLRSANANISLFLEKIKEYKIILGEDNIYKLASYDNAARMIREYQYTIVSGDQAQKNIKGVGKSLNEEIEEFLKTGTSTKLKFLENNADCVEIVPYVNLFTSYYGVTAKMAVEWVSKGYRDIETATKFEFFTVEQGLFMQHAEEINVPVDRKESKRIYNNFIDIFEEAAFEWEMVGEFVRCGKDLPTIDLVVENYPIAKLKNILKPVSTVTETETFYMAIMKSPGSGKLYILRVYMYTPKAYLFGILYRSNTDEYNIMLTKNGLKKGMFLTEFGMYVAPTKPRQEELIEYDTNGEVMDEKRIFKLVKTKHVSPKHRMGPVEPAQEVHNEKNVAVHAPEVEL